MDHEAAVLTTVARAAAGYVDGHVGDVARLAGGTRKGVYRVCGQHGRSVIVYRWHPEEDRWPTTDASEGAAEAHGCEAFLSAHAAIASAGLRVPTIHAVVEGAGGVDDDLVVLEDLGSRTLADVLEHGPGERDRILDEVAAMVRRLHEHQRDRPGGLAVPASGPRPWSQEEIVRAAERDLAGAREHHVLRAHIADLEGLLTELAARARPSGRWSLVHGELGPDHILVPPTGGPCMIDIEGLRYGEVEWEHAYLSLRFGDGYERLRAPALDPARLELYALTHHLSLVAGPLRLLATIGPDPTFESIVAHNADRLVDLVKAPR